MKLHRSSTLLRSTSICSPTAPCPSCSCSSSARGGPRGDFSAAITLRVRWACCCCHFTGDRRRGLIVQGDTCANRAAPAHWVQLADAKCKAFQPRKHLMVLFFVCETQTPDTRHTQHSTAAVVCAVAKLPNNHRSRVCLCMCPFFKKLRRHPISNECA